MTSPTQMQRPKRIRTNSISAWDSDPLSEATSPLLRLKNFPLKPTVTTNSTIHPNILLNTTQATHKQLKDIPFRLDQPYLSIDKASTLPGNRYGRRTRTSIREVNDSEKSKSLRILQPLSVQQQMKESCYIWQKEDSMFFHALRAISQDVVKRRERAKTDNNIETDRRKKSLNVIQQRKYSRTPIINIRGPEEEGLSKRMRTIHRQVSQRKSSSKQKHGRKEDGRDTTGGSFYETLAPLRERKYVKRSWKRRFEIAPSKMDY